MNLIQYMMIKKQVYKKIHTVFTFYVSFHGNGLLYSLVTIVTIHSYYGNIIQ